MGAFKQACGCTFDPELVDSVHNAEGQTHALKAAPKAVPPEEKASFLDKVLPKSKKSKAGD